MWPGKPGWGRSIWRVSWTPLNRFSPYRVHFLAHAQLADTRHVSAPAFQLSQLPPSTPSACLRGCLQEGGRAATSSPAKDICIAVTDECRSRLQEYQQAERQAQAYQRAEQRARDEAAGLQRKRKPRAKSTEIFPGLPPPPFTPGDAAMLLTGLAQLGLRVGGVVEPLVRQCKPRVETAPANDVTRILVALGDLSMEIREC